MTLKFPRDVNVALDLYVESPHILTLTLITVLRTVRHNKVEFHLKIHINMWIEWQNAGLEKSFDPGYMH